MLDEIERLVHEVKGVTEDIAHDLRTPLTRLLAGLERAPPRDIGGRVRDRMGAIGAAIIETRASSRPCRPAAIDGVAGHGAPVS